MAQEDKRDDGKGFFHSGDSVAEENENRNNKGNHGPEKREEHIKDDLARGHPEEEEHQDTRKKLERNGYDREDHRQTDLSGHSSDLL